MDGSVEVAKANDMFFIVTSNIVDTLLYIENMGPVTFFGYNNKSYHTSYAMTQRLDKSDDQSLRSIFIFADEFGHSSNNDQ